jgi:hypothetical protein
MHVNSWFQKPHGTKKIMVCYDKYWCHKFKTHKNLWCHKKSWIVMKICDTLLPNGMPCHHHMQDWVIINHKRQQYFQLVNKWDSFINQWHESWCEVSVTSHKVLRLLINLVAMWHVTSTSHDHKLLFTKSCKNQWNFVIT